MPTLFAFPTIRQEIVFLPRPRITPRIFLLLIAIYFIAARLGLLLAFVHVSASPVWPPTGIAIATILIFGYEAWPIIFIGAFLANVTTLGVPFASTGIAAGNTLEALLGAYLVNRFAGGQKAFQSPRNVVKFAVLAGFLSTLISPTIGIISLLLAHHASLAQFWPIWTTWWLGDLTGAIIITPLILVWWQGSPFYRRPAYIAELILLLFVLFCVTGLVFFSFIFSLPRYPLSFLILIPVMWAAFRFDRRTSTTAIALLGFFAVIATLNQSGPFVLRNPNESFLILQIFLATITIVTLLFSALIEQWRSAEQAIMLREKRFRSLIEKSYDAIALLDAQGTILYVSPSIERVAGYLQNEMIRTNSLDLVHPDDREGAIAKITELIERPEGSVVLEMRIRRKDGEWKWIGLRGTNMLDDLAVGALVINFRDISERRELEKAKSDFISVVSYQLRSPLSTIGSYVNSLLKKENRPFLETKYLHEIDKANTKMATLVNDLLRATRIELGTFSLQPRPTDLRRAIDAAVQELLAKINIKKISIRKHYDIPHDLMIVDPNFLNTIINILLSHSIERSPQGGEIFVSAARSDENIVIRISDHGQVISPDDQSRVFQKFFIPEHELEKDGEATGLGLYIVKALVELAGGTVGLESRTGNPTTFFVSFPCRTIQERRQVPRNGGRPSS